MVDSLVEIRVELCADRVYRFHTVAGEKLEQLFVNQLDTAAVGIGVAAAGIQRQLQAVEHGQQLLDQRLSRPTGELLLFALDALAVVIEFGNLSLQ